MIGKCVIVGEGKAAESLNKNADRKLCDLVHHNQKAGYGNFIH